MVHGYKEGDEPERGYSSHVTEEQQKWSETRIPYRNRQMGEAKTSGKPSLHLGPMGLQLLEEAFGMSEHVGYISQDREY